MQNTDNGDWLSAQQAVRPDGTEISNLPLINKKLPPLTTRPIPEARSEARSEAAPDSQLPDSPD